MRSDELLTRLRDTAYIGSASAWPQYTDAKLLNELNDRLLALFSDEIVTARAGYGLQALTLTCVAGTDLYPMPDRAVGGGLEKLELQASGETTWAQLKRLDINEVQDVDVGSSQPNRPLWYCIQDGFVELYPTPSQAFLLKFTYYIRPSLLVTSQSSTLGGDGVVRGQVTAKNAGARTVTVNTVPLDQLLAVPAAITSGNQRIDIVRPSATFACSMASQAQTLAGSVFTLGGTDDMTRVQIGDFVRVANQTDWPSNVPEEFHRMIADRAAMEVLREIGLDEKQNNLALTVQADLIRYRQVTRPQVKSQPKAIPLSPITQSAESYGRDWWRS